jgi:hypothetical protein
LKAPGGAAVLGARYGDLKTPIFSTLCLTAIAGSTNMTINISLTRDLIKAMFLNMAYSCPECGCQWNHKIMWRHTWWTPIVCPKCSKSFHFEKKQWRRISLPILISVGVLLIVQIVGKHLLGGAEYLVLFSLAFGVFFIVGIWWLHTVFTKLKFERRVET